jgi:cytochrome c oxidase subunit 2
MVGKVVVMEPAVYQQWLGGNIGGETMAAAGERLFQRMACANCHHADGTGRGPSLRAIYGTTIRLNSGKTVMVDDGYLLESILNPGAKVVAGYENIMPVFKGLISEEGLMQLTAYIKSLGTGGKAQ